ncbi:MAG: hypothetical protein J6Z22_09515, partial [Lachnospiraceae bacterium]|nr:hypothetical protein [Lachnospiraceae bacterium]
MKRKLFLFLFVIILSTLLLNGLLFYSAKLSAEYLQSKNVWGETEAIRLTDYRRQTMILASLPKDPIEAENLTQKFYTYLENQKKLKDTVLPLWRQEELMTPPDDIKENLLFTQLQEMDLTNYKRLEDLYYGVNHYRDYVASVNENAASVISLLYPLGNNQVSYQNALQCQKDFAGMESLVLVPTLDNGVNLVLQYHVTDFLAILMLVLISLLFYYHLKRQALLMVESISSLAGTITCFYSV